MGYAVESAKEILKILAETGGIPYDRSREAIQRALRRKKAEARKKAIEKLWPKNQ